MTTKEEKREMSQMRTDSDIARENYQRYLYALRQRHEEYVQKADKCEDFFGDIQWNEADKARLKKERRPYLTINKIKPIVEAVKGEYISNRASVHFVVSNRGEPEIAETLTKLYMHINQEQRLDWKEFTVFQDGIITSRGYYDVRVEFDDNLQGEVRVSAPNPRNVLPDPGSESYDPDDWNEVTLVHWLSLQDIEFFFGKKKAQKVEMNVAQPEDTEQFEQKTTGFGDERHELFDAGSDAEGDKQLVRRYFIVERQYRRLVTRPHFVDEEKGDTRVIPPNWSQKQIDAVLEHLPQVEVQELETRVIWWTVSAGNTLLHDTESPYKHFTIVPFFPIFRRGNTYGLVESLLSPQEYLNKTSSQELHVVNSMANSGWKVVKGALSNMDVEDLEQLGAQTGLVIELNRDLDQIEKIQPNNIPQGLDRISGKADQAIREISGIDDAVRGVARADMPGKSIQARQQASLINLAGVFESLAYTRYMLAKRILDLVQKYYTEERTIFITGNGLNRQAEEITMNQESPEGAISNDLTVGEYDVVVTPAPLRDTYQQSQFEQAKDLLELGISVPLHTLVENSDLANKAEIAEEMRRMTGSEDPTEEERAAMEQERQLERLEKEASIEARQAQAMLSVARARKVMSEVEQAGTDPAKLDELLLKAEQFDFTRSLEERSMALRENAQDLKELEVMENIRRQRAQERAQDSQQPRKPEGNR